jgi:hypothetical protein
MRQFYTSRCRKASGNLPRRSTRPPERQHPRRGELGAVRPSFTRFVRWLSSLLGHVTDG